MVSLDAGSERPGQVLSRVYTASQPSGGTQPVGQGARYSAGNTVYRLGQPVHVGLSTATLNVALWTRPAVTDSLICCKAYYVRQQLSSSVISKPNSSVTDDDDGLLFPTC